MNEIKSLISRSERYIKSAELLFNDGDYESAVSRVYYAMFYCVEAAKRCLNIDNPKFKLIFLRIGNAVSI